MKTFETERCNIPEGATHTYELVGDTVGFYRLVDGEWHFWSRSNQSWYHVVGNECAHRSKPIPQTNVETPEEKEVEWVNGDDVEAYGKLYKYVGLDPFNDNLCICLANQDDDPQCFSIEVLNKPETEVERVERERVEFIKNCKMIEDKFGDATITTQMIYGALFDNGFKSKGE